MTPTAKVSVLIVGGGYAGVEVAKGLGDRAAVTLVSDDNFLLFTPMLAEVAGADIDPRHIVAPLRELCPDTDVVVGTATSIDVANRSVEVRPPLGRPTRTYQADILVITAGSVSADFGVPGVGEWTLPFKTIGDALRIRNRSISILEEAAAERDETLTRVAVVGAGYSGVEVAAAVHDFMAGAKPRFYPSAPDPSVTIVDAADRITPALPPELSAAADQALRDRGIDIVLGKKVTKVDGTGVLLENDLTVPARTVIWAAGAEASPIAAGLGLRTDRRGRIEVDGWMRAARGVFALGDVAAVPDGLGGLCPPTAQHALRQGKYLGEQLLAITAGDDVEPFRYEMLGQFVSLGHRNAVGTVMGRQVKGLVGWFLWRSYYLFRLPTLLRKVRVALDWTIDLFFPPDIAELPTSDLGPDAV